jgi:hypothetical protein
MFLEGGKLASGKCLLAALSHVEGQRERERERERERDSHLPGDCAQLIALRNA